MAQVTAAAAVPWQAVFKGEAFGAYQLVAF